MTDGNKSENQTYERRKRKDYDYENLFADKDKKETTANEKEMLRKAYLTSQAYKTSSPSKTSLDLENEKNSSFSKAESSIIDSQIESSKVVSQTKASKADSKADSKVKSSADPPEPNLPVDSTVLKSDYKEDSKISSSALSKR